VSKNHTILSLDLGSTVGWCFIKNTSILQSGVVSLFRKDTHPGDRFLRFHNWLANWKGVVNEIFYEDVPRFESGKAARVYCGLLAHVQVFCLVHGIRMTNVKPMSVKKEFAGTGHADKAAMCLTAHKLGWRHGNQGTDLDHDEADAIATAWVLLKRRGIEPSFAYK
jgi:Holliday junction resolvasome RuvABC endonuclease subunit